MHPTAPGELILKPALYLGLEGRHIDLGASAIPRRAAAAATVVLEWKHRSDGCDLSRAIRHKSVGYETASYE